MLPGVSSRKRPRSAFSEGATTDKHARRRPQAGGDDSLAATHTYTEQDLAGTDGREMARHAESHVGSRANASSRIRNFAVDDPRGAS